MLLRFLLRTALAVGVVAVVSASALAQYGTGGTGGTGTTTGTGGTSPSYGSGKAIGIGVGGGVAAAIGIYAIHHRNASRQVATVVGCTEASDAGTKLVNEKDKHSYSLVSLSSDVKSGERVELVGKKTKDKSGKTTFRVEKLAKDYGPCNTESALNKPSPDHQ